MRHAVAGAFSSRPALRNATVGLAACSMTAAAQQLCRSLRHISTPRRRLIRRINSEAAVEGDLIISKHSRRVNRRRLKLLTDTVHPKGPGSNDRSSNEQVLNVVTSLPFVLVGADLLARQQHRPEMQQVGASLMLAGCTAMLYHGCKPQGPQSRLRTLLRKLDYWTVSLATASLMRAACPKVPQALQLSLAAIPYCPTAVTAAHVGVVEAHLMMRAYKQPGLRAAYSRHAAALTLGGACFAAEDLAIRHNISVVHSCWHLLAACAVSTAAHML